MYAGEVAPTDEHGELNLCHVRLLMAPIRIRGWRSSIHLSKVFDSATGIVRPDDEVCDNIEIRHARDASTTKLLTIDVAGSFPRSNCREI